MYAHSKEEELYHPNMYKTVRQKKSEKAELFSVTLKLCLFPILCHLLRHVIEAV